MGSCVGIDVSSASLDIEIRPQAIKCTVLNELAGFEQLLAELAPLKIDRVLFEATGGYERELMRFLQAAGYEVIRVNPRRARAFADSMGVKAKTDAIDAGVLAHFAQVISDLPAEHITPERALLQELLLQRDRFVQQRDDDRRRLKQAGSELVANVLNAHIRYLKSQIKLMDQEIECQTVELKDNRVEQLIQVKGIGMVTAAKLVALLPELGHVDSKAIASLVGLAPFNHDSGKYAGKRSIAGGRSRVRRALYMACWVVVRHNPAMKARYEALRSRGKLAKVAIVACMRALIVQLNAMIRTGEPWREQMS